MENFYLRMLDKNDFNFLYSVVNDAIKLISEVLEYRRLSFFQRLLTERVYEDINLKYSREFIQLATNIIMSFYEYRDIIFFTTNQSEELFKILKKNYGTSNNNQ